MEQQNKLNKIVGTLEDITNLVAYFAQENDIPEIERDLVKEKLRWVYDNIISLKPVNDRMDNENQESREVENKTDKPQTAIEDKGKETDISGDKPREVEFEINEMEEEQNPAEAFNEEELKSREETEEPGKKSEILSDKYKTGKDSVNEYMARHSSGRDVASKLQGKALKDIHRGIGINDKFQFINELFKGDRELYDTTINRLNDASDFNDAFTFIENNYNWDMDNPLVQKLLELTRRKFISSHNE